MFKILLSFAFIATSSAAKPRCTGDLESLWSRERITVQTPAGPRDLTFALDSEMHPGAAIRVLRREPRLRERLEKFFKNYRIRTEDLAALVEMSPAYFNAFGLRPDVKRGQDSYLLSDLSGPALAQVFRFAKDMSSSPVLTTPEPVSWRARQNKRLRVEWKNSRQFQFTYMSDIEVVWALIPLLNALYKEWKWPLVAGGDLGSLESKHKSWTFSPREIHELVTNLHKRIPESQTHLHIGLPGEIPSEPTLMIAQALEAKTILRLAAHVSGQKLAKSGFSTLVINADHNNAGARGAVGVWFGRWDSPALMHDMQIREYFSLREAFESAGMVITLAQNYTRLKRLSVEYDESLQKPPYDWITYNLKGALHYAGQALVESNLAANHPVGRKLIDYARAVGAEEPGDSPLRAEIAAYLLREEVDERLVPELFLEEQPIQEEP